MAKKDEYIAFILDELKKGHVKYSDTCLAFLSKFKCTEPTFAKYWKLANLKHTEDRNAIEKEKAIVYQTKEKEAFEAGLNDKHLHALGLKNQIDRLEDLLRHPEENEITPTDSLKFTAEIRALRKQLGEWYGFNAPAKIAETDSQGNDKEVEIVLPSGETTKDLLASVQKTIHASN
jgi:hypothetical protein